MALSNILRSKNIKITSVINDTESKQRCLHSCDAYYDVIKCDVLKACLLYVFFRYLKQTDKS